jgi:hypothetical protein
VRAGHLQARAQGEPGNDRRGAAQRRLRFLDDARAAKRDVEQQQHAEGHQQQPAQGHQRAAHAVEPGADKDRDVDDVAARQDLGQAEHLGEFVLRQPAAPLDEGPMRPGEDAAEARQRDFEESAKELGE